MLRSLLKPRFQQLDLFGSLLGGDDKPARSKPPAAPPPVAEASPTPDPEPTPTAPPRGPDFFMDGDRALAPNWRLRAVANLRAIELSAQITAAGRAATPEEQRELSLFVGYGSSDLANGCFLNPGATEFRPGWEETGHALRAAVDPQAYAALAQATQYAHYTPELIARAVWSAVERIGFRGGRVLEPGFGVGAFASLTPAPLRGKVRFTGVEFDPVSARIGALLHPSADVRCADFTRTGAGAGYALAVGNPPFSNRVVRTDPELRRYGLRLHDFFIVKACRALAPGGIAAFVTAQGTMDKAETGAREAIAETCAFLGAIRLPEGTFRAAAGTDVGVDLIFLRRRAVGEIAAPGDLDWIETRPAGIPENPDIAINGYWLDNPRMVLGSHRAARSAFGPNSVYACRTEGGADLSAALRAAIARLPAGAALPADLDTGIEPEAAQEPAQAPEIASGDNHRLREGSYFVAGKVLMQVVEGKASEVRIRKSSTGQGLYPAHALLIRDLIPIRDTVREILRLQEAGEDASTAQVRLGLLYDAFTAKRGPINKTTISTRPGKTKDAPEIETHRQPNLAPFRDDPDAFLVASIENYNEEEDEGAKGPIFFEKVIGGRKEPEIRNAADALARCLHEQGRVDLPRIAELASLSETSALTELGAALYRDPESGDWETADAYLSGAVRTKLRAAVAALVKDPTMRRNVEALEKVQPVDLPPSDITARLGNPWIPPDDVGDFILEVMGVDTTVAHTAETATWFVSPYPFARASKADAKYGTAHSTAYEALCDALNSRMPVIYVEERNEFGGTTRRMDPIATEAAKDKIADLKLAFENWVWTDPERADRLARIYNDIFNDLVPRTFDGSHLVLPGASDSFSFRPHQKRAIWRQICAGRLYAAHAVGAGKSAVLAAAVMEQRRLGLVNKPMMPVPGHCIAQVAREFLQVYPLARILVADEVSFAMDKRRRFLARAATGDWDCILITHSAFKLIGLPTRFEERMLDQQILEFDDVLSRVARDDRLTRKKLERAKEVFKQKLTALAARKDDFLTLAEIGVDQILVDEAQEFRKLSFTTNQTTLKGIDPNGSQMAWDLFAKAHFIRTLRRLRGDENDRVDRALVMASGTPVTNTLGEMFTIQRYMNPEALHARGLHEFDAWASTFGETRTDLELQPSGDYRPVTRFAEFVNVPELIAMFREFADVVDAETLGELVERPQIKGGKRRLITAPPSDAFKAYQKDLAARVETIENRKGRAQKGDDILLSVITDGRHAAIDMRLVDRFAANENGNKLNLLVGEALRIYRETDRNVYRFPDGKPMDRAGGAQMIFSDLGTLSAETTRGFSAYRWIKAELVRLGVPASEVAFVQDYVGTRAKARLFADVRSGKIRFVLGSTKKMGTGVNAQLRLAAIHHLDVPWIPSDIEQREGRGVRQGNQNKVIELLAYATEGSTDATMWQTNERKQRFITAAMRGDRSIRRLEDVGDAVNQFAMAKAIASGDPRLMQKAGLEAEVARLLRQRGAHYDQQHAMRGRIRWAEREIEETRRNALAYRDAAARGGDGEGFEMQVGRRTFTEEKAAGRALTDAMNDMNLDAIAKSHRRSREEERIIAVYRGLSLRYAVSAYQDSVVADLHMEIPGAPDLLLNTKANTPGKVAAEQIAAAAASLEERARECDHRAAVARDHIEAARPLLGLPFDLQGELDAKQAALDELDASLAAPAPAEPEKAAA